MNQISVEHRVTPAKLDVLGVDEWPIWSKEVSEFDWTYEQMETCYIIEGSAEITSADGETVKIGEGDLVVFPKGMTCTWKITAAVEKHYLLG